jgi:hypothetical protein
VSSEQKGGEGVLGGPGGLGVGLGVAFGFRHSTIIRVGSVAGTGNAEVGVHVSVGAVGGTAPVQQHR